ncbi:MAG TPA: cytochrome c oxidase subunit 3 [Candidatus Acidoferrales bacterium]|nr:cytochrome c oxidase subunit 3 [Candidatus Acidoferrales bacterium]
MNSKVETLIATGIPAGKVGMWWFLASEITVFGGLIASYIVVRLGSPGWSEAGARLNFSLGLVNTFVLLTSSLTMVLAFKAVGEKDPKGLRTYLGFTILLGLTFLTIKAFEYGGEFVRGYTPAAGIFWSFYYGMTGLHALHVFAGVVVNAIVLIAALGEILKPHEHRVELAGLYWHFVDIVWIFLFPLLYLT